MSQPTTDMQITLTEPAAEAIRRFLEAEQLQASPTAVTRLSVMPGGCSGFRYEMFVEDAAQDGDVVIEPVAGVRLAVDPFSASYLDGLVLDYKSTLTAAGFVFQNPNASGGCGCGSSFSA